MARKKLADLVNQRQTTGEVDETQHKQAEPQAAEAVHAIEEVDDRADRAEAAQHEAYQHGRAATQVEPEPATPTEQTFWQRQAGSQRPASRPVPKYLRLQRKEARLREDQLLQLTALARRMSRERRGKGERITENTLLRVAVDLLLAQEGELRGETEEEMQRALGLR